MVWRSVYLLECQDGTRLGGNLIGLRREERVTSSLEAPRLVDYVGVWSPRRYKDVSPRLFVGVSLGTMRSVQRPNELSGHGRQSQTLCQGFRRGSPVWVPGPFVVSHIQNPELEVHRWGSPVRLIGTSVQSPDSLLGHGRESSVLVSGRFVGKRV